MCIRDSPDPPVEDPDTGGDDTGTGDTGTGDTGGGDTGTGDTGTGDTGGGDTGTGDTGTGDTGGGDPDPTAPALPLAATSRWHPAFSTVTLDGDRVASAGDLQGFADVTALPGTGPHAMTDGLGRPFWRFDGDGYLTVADSMLMSSRDMTVFFVGRFHRIATRSAVFSIGSNAAGTASNTLGASLEASIQSKSLPLLRSFGNPRNTDYGATRMMAGSQMQVVGISCRANADGQGTMWLNEQTIPVSQAYGRVDIPGAEIGRYAYAPGASGSWGRFDLYEMIVVDAQITDTQGDALSADLMATYGIVPVTNQLVLEGDSIMQGTGDVTPALSAGMILTDPGAPQVGADWRVVNMATSGAKIGTLTPRRDALHGWPDVMAPGQNVMAMELGRNDLAPSGGETPATHRANILSYLTTDFGTPAQSILARGWDVRILANIAASPSFEPDITAFRAILRDPAFETDLGTAPGGAFAGQYRVIDTDLITTGGDTVFATPTDAADVTYYAGDSTHPSIAGAVLRATGGDDPAHGIAAGL